ncbi:MAG: bacillithiol system redox-active protein YtxJ [Sphingobacteriales bacterium]|nr:bacillithiol system redox-active protein YtxJ [Sphingobacteriales bacterium]
MSWIRLTSPEQLEEIRQLSGSVPQVIFKHSTRCSISSMVQNRLERSGLPQGIQFYHLDLLAYRNLSDQIAADFKVDHQSPQVLLIRNGECVYEESHQGISMNELVEQVAR